MRKRAFSPFFLLFLISCAYICDARKDGGDYWRHKMNGEPIPKAIKELFNQELDANKIHTNRFVTDFGNDSSFIVYHGQEPSSDPNPNP
ncbi:hypothetical protein F511_40056 [Dorcoceras hygrometricum]|uniref:Uncharacterized protein n=1 Tax=Dorcoceras hygrometricum TaxID=472368 RepID=A0A2Z7CM41_9LAMI|nr:hypothetical protein F511_40056 [Dorcoceras hygrometricum]